LAVGPPSRFIVGALAPDQRSIAFGTVSLRFCFLGTKKVTEACKLGPAHTGSFLPIPGTSLANAPSTPAVVLPSRARGVYATQVGFDRAGFWRVQVATRIGGKERVGTSDFSVSEHHAYPDYGDRATFIHVEVWRDFDKHEINKGAADWIFRNGDLLEPWVFLVGADGRIQARFDNVATRGEIEPLLRALPVLSKG